MTTKLQPTTEGLYPIRDIKKGEFVKKKADAKKVFIVGDYCRTEKKWELVSADDVYGGYQYLAGDKLVFAGFEY